MTIPLGEVILMHLTMVILLAGKVDHELVLILTLVVIVILILILILVGTHQRNVVVIGVVAVDGVVVLDGLEE